MSLIFFFTTLLVFLALVVAYVGILLIINQIHEDEDE